MSDNSPHQRLKFTASGSIGLILGVTLIAMLITGVIWLRQRSAEQQFASDMVMCASRLRQLGEALNQFAEDHGGRYPADLMLLITERYLKEDEVFLFRCPLDRDPHRDESPGRYVYVGSGLVRQPDSSRILLYDAMEHRPRDHWVLLESGQASLISTEELETALRGQGMQSALPRGR